MKTLVGKILIETNAKIYNYQIESLKKFNDEELVLSALYADYNMGFLMEMEEFTQSDFLDITKIRTISNKIIQTMLKNHTKQLKGIRQVQGVVDDIIVEYEKLLKNKIDENPSLKEALENFYLIAKLTI